MGETTTTSSGAGAAHGGEGMPGGAPGIAVPGVGSDHRQHLPG